MPNVTERAVPGSNGSSNKSRKNTLKMTSFSTLRNLLVLAMKMIRRRKSKILTRVKTILHGSRSCHQLIITIMYS